MWKRMIAVLLVLVLALGGTAGASDTREQGITRVEDGKMESLDGMTPMGELAVPQAETSGNCILPYDWTYGQSVVVGQTMRLRTWIHDVGLTDGLQELAIYKGTYETMDRTKGPVSIGVFPCRGTSAVTDFEWETTGLTPGDYTVLFSLKKGEEELVAQSYADLYLSDREIPLEGIDFYVQGVDGSPDRIATGLGVTFSVGLRYRPYHTTADRSYTVTSQNDHFQGSMDQGANPGLWSFQAPSAGADTVLTATCGSHTDHLTVHTREFETGVVAVTGHKVDPNQLEVKQAATATKDGLGTGACLYCGELTEVVISRIFLDTSGTAYYSDAVDDCYARGVIKGITENRFGPNQSLTRGMLVTMLYRYAGSPAMTGQTHFTDVGENRYYSQAVAWAEETQVANGYPDGTFRPDQNINREQLVTMLFRYVRSQEADNGLRDSLSDFDDGDKVSNFAWEPMQWAVANQVIYGITPTTLGPQTQATRAQTATVLYRTLASL